MCKRSASNWIRNYASIYLAIYLISFLAPFTLRTEADISLVASIFYPVSLTYIWSRAGGRAGECICGGSGSSSPTFFMTPTAFPKLYRKRTHALQTTPRWERSPDKDAFPFFCNGLEKKKKKTTTIYTLFLTDAFFMCRKNPVDGDSRRDPPTTNRERRGGGERKISADHAEARFARRKCTTTSAVTSQGEK